MYKLEAMRKDFVANVSHELRTPLTVIRGYLETLSMAESLPPVFEKAITNMQAQSQRMQSLAQDLLTLTKIETDDPDKKQTDISLDSLLKRIVSEAQDICQEKAHNITLSAEHSYVLRGNEQDIHSAISNLVINAVKYSPPSSDIILKVERASHKLIICVSDNGPGIDEKHLPRLTERFYRVENSRSVELGGTGLGLAIVKHVMIAHQGDLEIESQVGEGSHFSCIFPEERLITTE